MTYGNQISDLRTLAHMEIRKAFDFMKEGFKNIESRFQEAREYEEEFKYYIEKLKKDPSITEEKTPRGKEFREMLEKIDIVARMYEFANNQQEVAYRMTHVFIISVYEAFIRSTYKIILNKDKTLLVNKKPSEKLNEIANVDALHKFMNDDFKTDISSFPGWSVLREGFYRRHVIIHHHGIFSERYRRKMNCPASLVGIEFKTDFKYIENLKDSMIDFIAHLSTQILMHFSWGITGRARTAPEIIEKIKNNSHFLR